MQSKRITILGSTGSIGTSSLDVIREFPDRFSVKGLSAEKNAQLLCQQAKEFHPTAVCIGDPNLIEYLKSELLPLGIEVFWGLEGLVKLVVDPDTDMIVNALVGSIGLLPTLAALESGKHIALANKEPIVMAGELITRKAKERGVNILPIDSEPSAIWQCLQVSSHSQVRRLILTASGGPFRNWSKGDIAQASVEDALAHPTWTMGRKISVDSATLMNKGFEVIEAHRLFQIEVGRIEVVIHPQSIIHSLVEFIDGSIISQLSIPDMRLPIQYALTYPERWIRNSKSLSLTELGELSFSTPDLEKFPCLRLAFEAAKIEGTTPTVLNAVNEVTVAAFLNREISFSEIAMINQEVVESHTSTAHPDLESILDADRWARNQAKSRIKKER